MAIPVTTRSGKGSPLTQAEMDTNLTNLARSATITDEGNIEIATQAEVDAGTDSSKGVVPSTLTGGLIGIFTTTNGRLVLPGWANSFALQWTTATTDSLGAFTGTFPSTFTTAGAAVANAVTDNHAASVLSFSGSTASGTVIDASTGANAGAGVQVKIIAVGAV